VQELWLQKDCQTASWVIDGGMLASGNAVMKCVTESEEHEQPTSTCSMICSRSTLACFACLRANVRRMTSLRSFSCFS
jgi:hypothetical protein